MMNSLEPQPSMNMEKVNELSLGDPFQAMQKRRLRCMLTVMVRLSPVLSAPKYV